MAQPGFPSTGKDSRRTRRELLRQTAGVALAAGGLTGVTIVPRHALGGPRHIAPSEKVNIAGIGVGGQGFANLDLTGAYQPRWTL